MPTSPVHLVWNDQGVIVADPDGVAERVEIYATFNDAYLSCYECGLEHAVTRLDVKRRYG